METHRYMVALMLQVEIEAPNDADAEELVNDTFGEGACGGAEVLNMEILDFAQLS